MAVALKKLVLGLALLVGGCSSIVPVSEDVAPLTGPAPRLNTTPMAEALACIASKGRSDLRLGVADFVDGTGVMEGGTQNSRALSQRPDMMMTVALATAGAHLVNRSSVNVAEWEMNKAMEKKLGDGRSSLIQSQKVDFRPIKAGILLGSTHYVTGAITELNWNLSSNVAEAGAYSAALGRRTYRISIAVDVVVTNTQTTEIVHARSYKKQLVGFEMNANYFRFVNQDTATRILASSNAAASAVTSALELFNANLGEKQNEPTQTALRWVIELAAYDIMRNLKNMGSSCDQLLLPASEAAPAVVERDVVSEPPLRRKAEVETTPAAVQVASVDPAENVTNGEVPSPPQSAPVSEAAQKANEPAPKKRDVKSKVASDASRTVKPAHKQAAHGQSKRRIARLENAEIEALIAADRKRAEVTQQSASVTPAPAPKPAIASTQQGWMSGSVPARGLGLSPDIWPGDKQ